MQANRQFLIKQVESLDIKNLIKQIIETDYFFQDFAEILLSEK